MAIEDYDEFFPDLVLSLSFFSYDSIGGLERVMTAIFDTAFRSFFSIFSVRAINRGTLSTGSITMKRATVDLIKFSKKLGGITNTGNDDGCDDDKDGNNISINIMTSK
jgi:hypothetical protein